MKPDSSAVPAPTSADETNPTSSPAIPKGHAPTTTPMDGVALPPDNVSGNSKPVGGYNGSDRY